MKKWKKKLSHLFQALAGAMMIPVILLVVAGIFIGIGSPFSNMENIKAMKLDKILTEGSFIVNIFYVINSLGFMVMRYLPLYFAIGIGFGLSKKDKGWGAFGGATMFFALHTVINSLLTLNGITPETIQIDNLTTTGLSLQEAQNYSALFGYAINIFSYDMSVFGGILSGLFTAYVHNKYCETELPPALAFFSGSRFSIIMIMVYSVIFGIVCYYLWPPIGIGLISLGEFITKTGLIGSFTFGALDRALLPFGLHHLIAFPIEYTRLGGIMEIGGQLYEGVANIRLAQLGDPNTTSYITRNFITGRILWQDAGLLGACYAMYTCASENNKIKARSILIPAVLTALLVGITEPVEYTFLFVAPVLYYGVHVPLAGLAHVLTEIFNVSIMGESLRNMFPNLLQPQKVQAMALLWQLPLYFGLYFYIFRWAIIKWDIQTPGRTDQEDFNLLTKKDYLSLKAQKEMNLDNIGILLESLGNKSNITSITHCATRLRLEVINTNLVREDSFWVKEFGAHGVLRNDSHIQIIFGPKVITLYSQLEKILEE